MTWQYFKNNYLFRLSNLIGRYFTWLNNQCILQHITRFTRVRFVENSWKNICWTWPWRLVQEHQKQTLFGTRNVVQVPMLNFNPTNTCRSTFFCYNVSELFKLFCRHFRWSYISHKWNHIFFYYLEFDNLYEFYHENMHLFTEGCGSNKVIDGISFTKL